MVQENLKLCVKRTEKDVSDPSWCEISVLTSSIIVQAHLQHYTEPSADPLPSVSTLSGALLPLGQGTLTHNSAGVPIVVVCSKADLIDEGNDVIGAGTSGMGGMVKGKGGEWEERTDGIMQILRTVCLKCELYSPQPYPL